MADDGRKHLDQHLTVADRMATIGSLAAGVAHEINNPLTYVMTNLAELQQRVPRMVAGLQRLRQILGRQLDAGVVDAALAEAGLVEELDRELEQRVSAALEGAGRVQQCVADLRTLAQLEDEDAEQVPLQVHEVLDRVLGMAQNELRYRARVVREYGDTRAVKASPGGLSQVFLNLVLNAAQAMEEGKVDENELVVTTCMDGSEVVTELRDSGHGISVEDMPRLFEPFFTTRPLGEGSGMGLAICHSVVQGLGGTIAVDSWPGRGTRVTVRLPASRCEYRAVQKAPPPGQKRSGRILVVDDEPEIRTALSRLLSTEKHDVVTVGSGDEAQELLERDARFDLVLCDLMMKRGSGMDLYAWLEQNQPDLARRTLFLSGGGVSSGARRFLERMKDRAHQKPMDILRLLQGIQKILDEPRGETSP